MNKSYIPFKSLFGFKVASKKAQKERIKATLQARLEQADLWPVQWKCSIFRNMTKSEDGKVNNNLLAATIGTYEPSWNLASTTSHPHQNAKIWERPALLLKYNNPYIAS